jgi:oligogalacturonide transport system substrate-binding protein
MKRFVLSMLVLLVVSFAANAAGSSDSNSGSVADRKAEPARPVVLRMSWWGNESRHKAHLQAFERYHELHPNVTIEAEYGGMEGYRQKLTTQLAGRQEPDLMWIDPPWVYDFVTQGDFFVNLYEYKDLIDTSNFDQKLLNDYLVFNGKLIGLPTGVNAQCIAVDEQLSALGITLDGPWTWDKLIEAGKLVNQSNKEKYLILLESKFMNVIVLRAYMNQLTGKTLISDDYKMNFSESQLVEGLTLVQRLYQNKVVEPAQDADVFLQAPTTNSKWRNGDFYGFIGWSTTATSPQGFPKERIRAISFPQIPGSVNSGIVVRPMPPVCVSKNSKNIAEAVKFLNFYLNKGEGADILAPSRPFPATEEGRRQALALGIVSQGYYDAFTYSSNNAGLPDNPPSNNSEVEDAFLDMVQAVGYGTATPEKAAKDGIAALSEILSRVKR